MKADRGESGVEGKLGSAGSRLRACWGRAMFQTLDLRGQLKLTHTLKRMQISQLAQLALSASPCCPQRQ